MKIRPQIGITIIILALIIFSVFYVYNENKTSITGYVPAGVFVFSGTPLICDFLLEEDWNLVSFPCLLFKTPIPEFMPLLDQNFTSIHWYDSSDNEDHWKAYNPNLPNWVIQDIDTIYKEKGYWVNMPSSAMFYHNGTKAKPIGIQIKKGWNLIGYPNNVSRLINETIPFNYSVVYIYNASDTVDPWKVYYNPILALNDLVYLSVNYGYWIKSNEDFLWIANW